MIQPRAILLTIVCAMVVYDSTKGHLVDNCLRDDGNLCLVESRGIDNTFPGHPPIC